MTVLLLLWSLLGVSGVPAESPARAGAEIDAAKAFELLKTLEGTCEAAASDGRKATTTFELVANGSVLLERYSNPAMPGGGRMVSAYHLDGPSLVLTHYCIAKNQPTLRAATYDSDARQIQFEFLRAGSLPDQNAGHMRRAMYRVTSKDAFTTEWEFFARGQRTFGEVEHFTRVR